jgi:hypothetical protein
VLDQGGVVVLLDELVVDGGDGDVLGDLVVGGVEEEGGQGEGRLGVCNAFLGGRAISILKIINETLNDELFAQISK